MKKTLLLLLVLVSLILILIRFSGKLSEVILDIKPKSGISVLSEPSDASVFLDNVEVGKTPYENQNLAPKEYLVKVSKQGLIWQGRVKLKEQTITVVSRELSKDQAFGAGEILSLERGKGLTVLSNPSGAEIEIDGKNYGLTPQSLNIEDGEHTISLSHPNYSNRNIRSVIPKNFNLIVSVDLAISEADLTLVSTPPIQTTPQLKVLDTPTGFLRVRDKPSTVGKEIGRVKPGEDLTMLEELDAWYKVRLTSGSEGYVFASYVQKQTP